MAMTTAPTPTRQRTGMVAGGIWTTALAAVGLIAIIFLTTFRIIEIPGGWSTLAGVSIVAGVILIVGGMVIDRLDEHLAEHAIARMDGEDLTDIRNTVHDLAHRPPLDEQTRASLLNSMYEHIVRAVRDARASGYVDGVKRRMGGGGHLRMLPPSED